MKRTGYISLASAVLFARPCRLAALLTALFALAGPALAEDNVSSGVEESAIAADARIRTMVYNENQVYRLLTRYGYQSSIELADGEKILTLSLGDSGAFKVTPAGRRIFIKSLQDEAVTNMTLVTNFRPYQFELASTTDSGADVIYVMRFFYPDVSGDEAPVRQSGAVSPAPVMPPLAQAMQPPVKMQAFPPQPMFAPPVMGPPASTAAVLPPPPAPTPSSSSAPPALPLGAGPGALPPQPVLSPSGQAGPTQDTFSQAGLAPQVPAANYNYSITGPDSIAPLKIFDDGVSTFFKFSQGNNVPAFYSVSQDGKETVVPARQEQEYVVLSGVFSRLALRSGTDIVCVFNDGAALVAQR